MSIHLLLSRYKNLFLIFCLGAVPYSISSQSVINKTAKQRAKYNITSSTGYNFKIVNGEVTQDSFITVKREFNKRGFRIETSVYKETKIRSCYKFEYLGDTLLDTRKTYVLKDSSLVLIQTTKMEYNKDLQFIKAYDINTLDRPKYSERSKYNKDGKLVRNYLKINGKKRFDQKYKYDDQGNLIEKTNCKPKKEKYTYTYDTNNQLSHIHLVQKNGKRQLINYYDYVSEDIETFHILNQSTTILGINGGTKLSKEDVLTTVRKIGKHSQIQEEEEYLNGKLIGFRKYYYR